MSAPFLLTYDIASPKRLIRLHRALKKRAMPIQYSVFLGRFSRAGLQEVEEVIRAIIHPKQDDVRIYPLPAHSWRTCLGRPVLPAGIHLTLLPDVWPGLRDSGPSAGHGQQEAAHPATPPPPRTTDTGTHHGRHITARIQTGQRRGIQLLG